MDEKSESSISTPSSSPGVSPNSPRAGSRYGDEEPAMYEIIEHFSYATNLDPHRGYIRHAP